MCWCELVCIGVSVCVDVCWCVKGYVGLVLLFVYCHVLVYVGVLMHVGDVRWENKTFHVWSHFT